MLLRSSAIAALVAVAAIGISLAVTNGMAPASGRVTEIHYSFGDNPGTVWFDWRGQQQDIFYGRTTSYGHMAVAVDAPVTPVDSRGPFRQVELTGLRPSTAYHYKIGPAGPDHTFRTIPEGSFTWVDIGDTSTTACEPWVAKTQALVATQHPDFVTHGGDISYANDCGVRAVHQYYVDQQVWSESAAFEPVWGNHEFGPPGSEDGMTAPRRTPADSLANYKGRSFVTNGQAVSGDTATATKAPGCGAAAHPGKNTCQGNDWGWFETGHVLFISYPEAWPGVYPAWQSAAAGLMARAQTDPNIDFIVTYGHPLPYSSVEPLANLSLRSAIDSLALTYSPSAAHPDGKYVLNVDHHAHWEEAFRPIDGLVNITNGGGGAGQVNPARPDPQSLFHISHLGILAAHYSASGHTLTVSVLCGPAWPPDPQASCGYGDSLYSLTFTRPSGSAVPARLRTVLTASNTSPYVGQQVTYQVSVRDQVVGSVARGVSATVTLPPNETVVNANGGTVTGRTVRWNLGDIAGGQPPVTAQVQAQLVSGSAGYPLTIAAGTSAAGMSCRDPGSTCGASSTGAVGQAPPAYQWASNPGVEHTMTGWGGRYGRSPQVSVIRDRSAAHTGSYGIKVTGLPGAQNLVSGFSDKPRWVPSTVLGTTYTASAWVRPSFAGQKITLRLSEWNGRIMVGSRAVTITARAAGWQQLRQSLIAVRSGDQLSFSVYADGISAGQYFYADDFSLTSPS